MIARLALRNLLRNRWRSGLTALGVAAAVATLVWTAHMIEGMYDQMARGATAAELGDVQIHAKAYIDERSMFNAFDPAPALEAARSTPGVAAASARTIAYGLVGRESQSAVARLVGVDPAAEAAVTTPAHALTDGTWLPGAPPEDTGARPAVLGAGLARQLGAKVGAELVVFLQAADGSLGNDLLRVVGVARTGNSALDRTTAWMRLDHVQELAALDGRAHEIAIALERGRDPEVVAQAIAARVDDPALAVRPWTAIVPELHELIEVSRRSTWLLYLIVYFIAGLGILNTQRMAALERRRELGVLAAIGTTPGRLAGQVIAEAVALATVGGVVGAGIGALVSYYHQVNGLNWSDGAGELTYMGVDLSHITFRLSADLVVQPLLAMALIGALCGLWPAIKSARQDVPRAIAGRT